MKFHMRLDQPGYPLGKIRRLVPPQQNGLSHFGALGVVAVVRIAAFVNAPYSRHALGDVVEKGSVANRQIRRRVGHDG